MEALGGLLVTLLLICAVGVILYTVGVTILELIAENAAAIFVFVLIVLGIVASVRMAHKAAESRKEVSEAAKRRLAEEEAAKAAAKEKALQRLAGEERDRVECIKNIENTMNAARRAMREIAKCLNASEQSVVRAAANFEKRSFYPFWDCVAEAVSYLSNYKTKIEQLDYHGTQYAKQVEHYRYLPGAKGEHVPKPFPVSSASLPALRNGAATAERINALYDHAHRDFEFSSIYANWKTNQTLVQGFENMSDGLDAIRDELQHVGFTLNSGFNKVSRSVVVGAEAVMGAIDKRDRDD